MKGVRTVASTHRIDTVANAYLRERLGECMDLDVSTAQVEPLSLSKEPMRSLGIVP